MLVLYYCGMVKSIKMDQSEEKARAEAFDVFLFSNRFFYGYIALATQKIKVSSIGPPLFLKMTLKEGVVE